ncbi:MAG: DUF4292 domain-containing protein [Desulforhopalus sp.]
MTGCASKPWRTPLGPDQTDETTLLVASLAARDQACPPSLEGDISFFYRGPLDKMAVNGFLQFSLPSSYKFVMTNPLGQPLLAIAGNQQSYQVINTLKHHYLAGSISSFGLQNNIDAPFLKGNWGDWLMGRNNMEGRQLTSVRHDHKERGLWVSFESDNKSNQGTEHLLVTHDNQLYLSRIIEDDKQNVIAEITYDKWVEAGECSQPLNINIKGLGYGTEIHIRLSNIALIDEQRSYRLPVPPGYIRQFRP